MTPPLYDAHNHLQDERLAPVLPGLLAALERQGVARMVVNGSSEEDWRAVLELARVDSRVIPCFGYHPWYVRKRSTEWERNLRRFLDQAPSGVGEIGLDRWIKDYDLEDQGEVFERQMRIAAERELPVIIHCLQAWGKLQELLEKAPRPKCGFLLHSFGGPEEMVPALTDLGAYFSLPGYFAQERKSRQRNTFLKIPRDRLLLETDAPDQLLPEERILYPLVEAVSGKPLNHPGNITAVYQFASELFGEPLPELAARVQANFLRLFGGITRHPN